MTRSIVIVGAGPAGMAAAIESARIGSRVTLIDEAALPGGQIYRQSDPELKGEEFADRAERDRKHRLIEAFNQAAGSIDYRAGAAVYALFANGEVHVAQGNRTEVLRPDATILATGVRELAMPFPGWTTPGVMFAGGVQALLKSQRVLAGRKIVVAGCGPLPVVVAAQILRAGGALAALAPLRSLSAMLRHPAGLWHGRAIVREGIRYAWSVRRADVRVMTGFVPIRAIGKDQIEAVVLARVDAGGHRIPGTEREIACDLLAINYGFVANSELAAMAGARTRRDPIGGGWLPIVDEFGRTSVPGLLVAGDGAGLRGALIAEIEGTIAAAAAASPTLTDRPALTRDLAQALARRRKFLRFQEAVRTTLRLPLGLWRVADDETIVCRCENVRLGEVRVALEGGHRSINALKRNVRTGMGWCGGRICLHGLAALIELHTGTAPAEMMTPRPMMRPVSFTALARQKRAAVP